jgi:hypothetical protein
MRFLFVLIMASLALSACAPEPPSDDDLRRIFLAYEERFEDAGRLCEMHSSFRSVEPREDRIVAITASGERLALDPSEEQRVASLLKDAKLLSVICVRGYRKTGEVGPVIVRYVAYAAGLSVSGRMKAIDYMLEENGERSSSKLESGDWRKLPKEGWYIYDVQS